MADYTYASVVILDADKANAQADLGDGFFNTGLSADGTEPATHWISSGPWSNEELDKVCNQSPDGFEWPYQISFGQDWQGFIAKLNLQMVVSAEQL